MSCLTGNFVVIEYHANFGVLAQNQAQLLVSCLRESSIRQKEAMIWSVSFMSSCF